MHRFFSDALGEQGALVRLAPEETHHLVRVLRLRPGDEVALFHGAYLATHTDRRLFIADPGNARVVSVKLGYHASERVALKDVPRPGKGGP